MKASPDRALVVLVVLICAIGSVAPSEDSLSPLAGSFSDTTVAGKRTSGPISISDSIIGDIISINVNVKGTIRTNVSAELLQILVCALNEHGNYGIEMEDVRRALGAYVARHGSHR